MKTKVLAVLLAVCMIASSCVLFASAATTFKQDTYVVTKDGTAVTASTPLSNLKTAAAPKDVKVTAKSAPTASTTATSVTDSNVESLCDFNPSFSTIKGDVAVSGSISSTSASVTVEATGKIYKIADADVTGELTQTLGELGANFIETDKYTINGLPKDTITVSNVKKTEKLYSLTMGLRFYGDNGYKNLNSSEIAEIKAVYKNVKGAEITVYADTINDLREGTVVTVSTKLKDEATYGEEYAFNCWADGSGNVIASTPSITWTAGTSDSPIYAVYTELKSRVRINYSTSGNGGVAYQESTSSDKIVKRDVINGEGQLSVMEGRKVTFVFTPDEGYEVAHVYVDKTGSGEVIDVASFASIPTSSSWLNALKALINATNKDVYEYTFTSKDLSGMVDQIRSIEVVFAPIENFEVPSGKELPTVEAEGITLATGADDSNGGNNGDSAATTVPAEDGAAGSGASAIGGVVNPATGSTGAIAVFATLSVAAAAAFVTAKKKEN